MNVTRCDYSPDTGSLVVCTCGGVLGPFQDRKRAAEVADTHRRVCQPAPPDPQRTPEQRERYNAAQRAKRNARRERAASSTPR